MKKLFTRSLFLLLLLGALNTEKLIAQTVFETVSSGAWSDINIWRSWASGTIGVGNGVSPTLNVPVGTNKVVIHAGHIVTMGGANRSCHGLTIETSGALLAGETTPRRLQIATGGTGFPYPVNDTVQNDGAIGGVGDGIYFEPGTNAGAITLTGSGSYDIERIRIPGGIGSTGGGIVNLLIDADINLYQSGNYALTAVYNPTVSDNYTVTINSGKTVKIIDPAGYFHNSQNSSSYGNYTYDIKGTLDLSSNTQTSSNVSANILVPAGTSSKIIINVDGGVLKLGSAFKGDTSMTTPGVSSGILTIEATNNGLIDASNTTNLHLGKNTDGLGGVNDLFFGLDATGKVSQTVGATEVKFPIGLSTATTSNAAYLTNSGTADVFSIGLNNSFTNVLADPTKVVNRQWDISEAVAGGSDVTVRLAWLTADQSGNFNPANPIFTIHNDGGQWTETSATITGSGTVADPYISNTSGFTSFSPFGIDNQGGVATPVSFVNIKAAQDDNRILVNWANANELNVKNYVIEKSADGINFSPVASVSPKTNNGLLNSYVWLDNSPFSTNNFYRIEAIGQDAAIKYSTIAKVNIGSRNSGIAIYPNPVADGVVGLQLTDMPKGIYNARLIAVDGKVLMNNIINHSGGSATQTLQLNDKITKGTYLLQIINPDNSITSLKLVKQ